MQITSISKPMKRCTMWWGTASYDDGNYEWFYEPRRGLCMRKKEVRIRDCFMNIQPPEGARRTIVG
jgi:hypothetical protein